MRFSTRLWLMSICGSLSLLLCSCGGGTTGTGGTGSDQFVGKILSELGQPVINAVVVVEETGDSAVSDENGNFELTTDVTGATATVLVSTQSADARVVVDEIPDEPVVITVSLELDSTTNSLTVKTKDIKKKKRPRKTPTPVAATPIASATPSLPGATPLPATPVPSATPETTPSILPTESPTPSVTEFAIYKGTVTASDSSLLLNAEIGLVGQGRRDLIAPDGSFRFRGVAQSDQYIVVKLGDERAAAALDGMSADAKKVVIGLTLDRRANGRLRLSLNSIRITNQIDTETSQELESLGP